MSPRCLAPVLVSRGLDSARKTPVVDPWGFPGAPLAVMEGRKGKAERPGSDQKKICISLF